MIDPVLTPQMFRANVGIILVNEKGEVLALERKKIPGAWQLPQGGIQNNEEPLQAAQRELKEETGISADQTELVGECPEWLAYELPRDKWSAKTGRGQAQKWFLFRLRDRDTKIALDMSDEMESRAWRWMKLSELIDITVAFRKGIYTKLSKVFCDYLT
jgi:putative (di)nucleoside polyphosphate hydrolase